MQLQDNNSDPQPADRPAASFTRLASLQGSEAGFFLEVKGALLKVSQPPLPDVPPAAGFHEAEYRFAAIPRLPGEQVGFPVEASNA